MAKREPGGACQSAGRKGVDRGKTRSGTTVERLREANRRQLQRQRQVEAIFRRDDLRPLFEVIEGLIHHGLVAEDEQPRRLVLWCEASGMVPQLARIADPFNIEVCSSGGFDSLTDKYKLGRHWADQGAITLLHIRDQDPSGVHMCQALAEDLIAFACFGGVEIVRLGVLPDQAATFGLVDAPPKESDDRRFDKMLIRVRTGEVPEFVAIDPDKTWQVELDPRDLADIVRSAIETRLDRAAFERVIEHEIKARQDVLSLLSGLDANNDGSL
jgi:hypothetical protein